MRMRRIALVIYEGETEVKALRESLNPSTGVYKLVEMKKVEQFCISIERDSDGTYIAFNVDNSHYVLLGRGATVDEAKRDFENSMREVREYEIEERGEASPLLSAEPEYRFDVSSLFEY